MLGSPTHKHNLYFHLFVVSIHPLNIIIEWPVTGQTNLELKINVLKVFFFGKCLDKLQSPGGPTQCVYYHLGRQQFLYECFLENTLSRTGWVLKFVETFYKNRCSLTFSFISRAIKCEQITYRKNYLFPKRGCQRTYFFI